MLDTFFNNAQLRESFSLLTFCTWTPALVIALIRCYFSVYSYILRKRMRSSSSVPVRSGCDWKGASLVPVTSTRTTSKLQAGHSPALWFHSSLRCGDISVPLLTFESPEAQEASKGVWHAKGNVWFCGRADGAFHRGFILHTRSGLDPRGGVNMLRWHSD